jgi:hypothetical protein
MMAGRSVVVGEDSFYLPDFLRLYDPGSELGERLCEAADLIESHSLRADKWFEAYFKVLAEEHEVFNVAVELADVLYRYAVRLDIGHEPGVVDALAHFARMEVERTRSRRKWDRTAGGFGAHPSNWE